MNSAIIDRLPVAESFEQYPSLFEREYPYYRIYVDNFIVSSMLSLTMEADVNNGGKKISGTRDDRDNIA